MGTMNPFRYENGDHQSQISNAIDAPEYVDVMFVTTSAETYTIPTGVNVIVFSADKDFFVRWDGSAAAVPTTEVADGTGSEINPTSRGVRGKSTFSIIGAAADTIVTLACFA